MGTYKRSVDLASTLVYRARVTSTPTHVAALASRARMYSTNPCRQHILACGKVLQAPQDIPAGPAGSKKKKKKKKIFLKFFFFWSPPKKKKKKGVDRENPFSVQG